MKYYTPKPLVRYIENQMKYDTIGHSGHAGKLFRKLNTKPPTLAEKLWKLWKEIFA